MLKLFAVVLGLVLGTGFGFWMHDKFSDRLESARVQWMWERPPIDSDYRDI